MELDELRKRLEPFCEDKFAIITGSNLSPHRRGKRVDPTWEEAALSMTSLIDRANELPG